MTLVLAFLATLARFCRPSRGLHSAPLAVRREVREEARANRVRRYADPLPALPSGPGFAEAAPVVPAPRRAPDDASAVPAPVPADYAPVADPLAVVEAAPMIQGFYLDFERRQARARTDRSRLGLAVLAEIAANTNEVSA